MSNIPAGYRLNITTWENDADHYMTQVIDGLTEKQVRFYIDLASHFKSTNDPRNPGLGNAPHDEGMLLGVFNDVAKQHGYHEHLLSEDDIYDWLTEHLLGYPVEEGYRDEVNFCRVFDNYTVYYIPEELEDVTRRFE